MGIVVVHASRLLHVRVATDTMDIVYGVDLIIYTGGTCACARLRGMVWYGVVCGVD